MRRSRKLAAKFDPAYAPRTNRMTPEKSRPASPLAT
jgi:hypothetical protein